MPNFYSVDLRKKVVAYVKQTGSLIEASRLFTVSYSSVQRWLRQEKQSGHLRPQARTKLPHKINYEALLQYIKDRPDATLKEMAAHFAMSIAGIYCALKRLKVTRKKSRPSIKKEMKP
jgi:transposase